MVAYGTLEISDGGLWNVGDQQWRPMERWRSTMAAHGTLEISDGGLWTVGDQQWHPMELWRFKVTALPGYGNAIMA